MRTEIVGNMTSALVSLLSRSCVGRRLGSQVATLTRRRSLSFTERQKDLKRLSAGARALPLPRGKLYPGAARRRLRRLELCSRRDYRGQGLCCAGAVVANQPQKVGQTLCPPEGRVIVV